MRVNKSTPVPSTPDRDQRDAMRQARLNELLRQSAPNPQPVCTQPPGIRKPGR